MLTRLSSPTYLVPVSVICFIVVFTVYKTNFCFLFSDLVTCVYSSRPRQVVLHVLPLLWHLLGTVTQSGATPGGTGNLRISTNHLVHALLSQMGDSLVEHAKNQSSVTPRMTQCLQDMIDNPTLDD